MCKGQCVCAPRSSIQKCRAADHIIPATVASQIFRRTFKGLTKIAWLPTVVGLLRALLLEEVVEFSLLLIGSRKTPSLRCRFFRDASDEAFIALATSLSLRPAVIEADCLICFTAMRMLLAFIKGAYSLLASCRVAADSSVARRKEKSRGASSSPTDDPSLFTGILFRKEQPQNEAS